MKIDIVVTERQVAVVSVAGWWAMVFWVCHLLPPDPPYDNSTLLPPKVVEQILKGPA